MAWSLGGRTQRQVLRTCVLSRYAVLIKPVIARFLSDVQPPGQSGSAVLATGFKAQCQKPVQGADQEAQPEMPKKQLFATPLHGDAKHQSERVAPVSPWSRTGSNAQSRLGLNRLEERGSSWSGGATVAVLEKLIRLVDASHRIRRSAGVRVVVLSLLPIGLADGLQTVRTTDNGWQLQQA